MNQEIGSINELALFAGAGGGILGSILTGWRTICAVEIDSYCREVLLQRQRDGLLPLFPIWDDVRTFDGGNWRGSVDVISAGFPCQPFSVAGKKLGDKDQRNLWPDTIRIIREVGPKFCLLENVPGLLAHGYVGRIFGDLAESGYDCRWDCIPASSIGANHQRDRLWIVAYSMPSEQRGNSRKEKTQGDVMAHTQIKPEKRLPFREGEEITVPRINGEDLAHANGSGFGERRWTESIQEKQSASECGGEDVAYAARVLQGRKEQRAEWQRTRKSGQSRRREWWIVEPDVGRVAHGVASRVDRLKAIGNGQVPGVVEKAWKQLTENL